MYSSRAYRAGVEKNKIYNNNNQVKTNTSGIPSISGREEDERRVVLLRRGGEHRRGVYKMAAAQLVVLQKEMDEKEKPLREGDKTPEAVGNEGKRLQAGKNAELPPKSNRFDTAASSGFGAAVASPTDQPARNQLFTPQNKQQSRTVKQ